MIRKLLTAVALVAASAAASAATVDTLTVESKHLDTPMRVTVAVPDADGRHPSVYLLNGYTGDYTSWIKLRPDMGELADKYGFVIVMPDGRDSWYWDSRPGLEMESFFVEDLVPYIDSSLPTIPDPAKRAISGLSMGGHGAMWLGIRHSDIWGSAATMSGGVDIRPFAGRWNMAKLLGPKDENTEKWESHTVANLVKQLKPGQLNILIDCGVDDFFSQVNRHLHQSLLDAGIDHDYIERPGGHSGKYWANSVLYHLLFFNEAFKK